jgi:hypothetical protein
MSETPPKNHPDFTRGYYAAQDFSSGAGGEPSPADRESPEFSAGWNAFVNLRAMFARAGFIENAGVFIGTFSTGGK